MVDTTTPVHLVHHNGGHLTHLMVPYCFQFAEKLISGHCLKQQSITIWGLFIIMN